MLSILEVLELLVDLCILTFSQKKRGRKDKKEWNQDEGELVKVQTQGEKNVNFAWVLGMYKKTALSFHCNMWKG